MDKFDQNRTGVQVGNRGTKGYYNIYTHQENKLCQLKEWLARHSQSSSADHLESSYTTRRASTCNDLLDITTAMSTWGHMLESNAEDTMMIRLALQWYNHQMVFFCMFCWIHKNFMLAVVQLWEARLHLDYTVDPMSWSYPHISSHPIIQLWWLVRMIKIKKESNG